MESIRFYTACMRVYRVNIKVCTVFLATLISFIKSWPPQIVCLWFLYLLISKCSDRFWEIMASDQILLSLNLGQGWENCGFWEMYMISLRFCFTFSRNPSEFDSLGWSNSTFGSRLSGTAPHTLAEFSKAWFLIFCIFSWLWRDLVILGFNFLGVGLRLLQDTHFTKIWSRISTLAESMDFIKIWYPQGDGFKEIVSMGQTFVKTLKNHRPLHWYFNCFQGICKMWQINDFMKIWPLNWGGGLRGGGGGE